MDIYDKPYYKITKISASLIGRWPYQSSRQSLVIVAVIWIAFILQAIPQIIAIVTHFDDREVLLEALAPFIIDIMFVAKYMNSIYNAELMINLFERMKQDWKLLSRAKEKCILEYHTNIGRLISTGYAGFAYTTTAIFLSEPILPRVINYFSKSNESVPLKFALPLEYIIFEKENHYWLMLAITNMFAINMIIVTISCDIMFITFVQHVCGLFAVVGFRIENSPTGKISDSRQEGVSLRKNSHDVSYKHLVSCIRSHRRALEFVKLLEETFTGTFGVVVALNLPMISITGLQLITQSNTVEQTLKYLTFALAQVLHLFFDCFLSQNLTNMSSQIPQCIANMKWYNISKKSQKLILLMTMRSQTPCKLTAGKIMELSIENFGMMMKTSGSYFTMLLSMQ
ncbi:odorant receptor 22c-like [Microplitis demolitor]|uniref:odorant receptor 22c-like n=1 Tax=Microplitis demolitor TaxID=69319 RepID=UPI0004CCA599|nr:odorant receptor 22c-like [Microplitis demolitor]